MCGKNDRERDPFGIRRRLWGLAVLFLLCLAVTLPSGKAFAVSGQEIVNYAKSFVGKVPYVYGGNSMSTGTDCSGFVCNIYNHYNINLWPYRTKIRNSPLVTNIGTDLEKAKPGDILWFEGHVAIYTGKVNGVHYMVNETKGTYSGITDNVIYSPVTVHRNAMENLRGVLVVSGVNGYDPAPADPWTYAFTSYSGTDARLKATYLSNGKGSYTKAGIRIWKKWNDQYITGYDESCSHNMANPSVWYDVNKELKISLQPGVTYRVQFYVVFNGQTVWSQKKDYTSPGTCPHSWNYQYTIESATALREGTDCYQCGICGVGKNFSTAKLTPTVTLSRTSVLLKLNGSETVTVSGLAAGDYVASWRSADPSVASVSGGTIKAGSVSGSTTVTVTLASGKTASVSVTTDLTHTHAWVTDHIVRSATVLQAGQRLDRCSLCGTTRTVTLDKLTPSITLNKTSVSMRGGGSFQIWVSGLAAGDQVSSYKSADPKVATVSAGGLILPGKRTGRTVVRVTLKSGKTAAIRVNVNLVKKVPSFQVKAHSKRRITASWKKIGGITGYQIGYVRARKWKDPVIVKAERSRKTITFQVKKKTTYYVRIRAYKFADGRRFYGKWSSVKKIRTFWKK